MKQISQKEDITPMSTPLQVLTIIIVEENCIPILLLIDENIISQIGSTVQVII